MQLYVVWAGSLHRHCHEAGVDRAAEVINEKGFMVQGQEYIVKPVYYDSKYVPQRLC